MRNYKNMMYSRSSMWRCNTPGLLKEVLENPSTWVLAKPIQIFADILSEVAERCSELNDPILNGLMCRLALYELSDPNSKEYDEKKCDELIDIFYKERSKKNEPTKK